MPRRAFGLAVASLSIFIGCLPADAQPAPQESSTPAKTTVDDQENKAILEVGGASGWNVSGGAATFAPNLAAEIEPIENWLELELGVSPFYTHNSKEWDTALLFKKPWTLSRKAEFMLGIGREWVHRAVHRPFLSRASWEEQCLSRYQKKATAFSPVLTAPGAAKNEAILRGRSNQGALKSRSASLFCSVVEGELLSIRESSSPEQHEVGAVLSIGGTVGARTRVYHRAGRFSGPPPSLLFGSTPVRSSPPRAGFRTWRWRGS
jgi:hypothetical protein